MAKRAPLPPLFLLSANKVAGKFIRYLQMFWAYSPMVRSEENHAIRVEHARARPIECRIGMFEARIKLGQYLYLKHGAKVVFLGRFVALLRILAAFLAGVNRMPWRAFLIANASRF
jgi:membrane protein DedA with SNARE-associated domain